MAEIRILLSRSESCRLLILKPTSTNSLEHGIMVSTGRYGRVRLSFLSFAIEC